MATEAEPQAPENFGWLDTLAGNVIEAAGAIEGPDAVNAQFFDDLQTLDRLTESYDIQPSLRAYSQIALFTIRFDINWLVVADRV
jgi:hypothetical protein